LTVVALISIVLFGAGTAHAVFGIPDDVKDRILSGRFFAPRHLAHPTASRPTGPLLTLWGGTPDAGGNVATMNCTALEREINADSGFYLYLDTISGSG